MLFRSVLTGLLLHIVAVAAQSAVILTTVAAYGPNPVSPVIDIYNQEATRSLQKGYLQIGDRWESAEAYEAVQGGPVPSYALLTTGLTPASNRDSYWGEALPSTKLSSANFIGEQGNGLYWGVKIKDDSSTPGLTLAAAAANLTFDLNGGSSIFNLSGVKPFEGVTQYSHSIVGIRPDNTLAVSANEAVKAIYFAGVFTSADVIGFGGSGLSLTQYLDNGKSYFAGLGNFNMTGTYKYGATSSAAIVSVTPATLPEPAVLSMVSIVGVLLLKRRR